MADIEPVNILQNANPTAAGNNGIFPGPISLIDSGTVFDPMAWIFTNSGTRDGLDCLFRIPKDYSSAGVTELKIGWIVNNASANSVIFDWELLNRAAGEDTGAAADRATETVTDASTGTAFQLEVAVIPLTEADYTPGNWLFGRLLRSSDLAGDNTELDIAVLFAEFYSQDSA